MKLPEFTLLAGTVRSLRSSRSKRMHWEGEVFVYQRHLIAKLFPQSDQVRIHFLTVGALIVGKFDNLNGSRLRTESRSIPHLDAGTRLAQLDHHVILPP